MFNNEIRPEGSSVLSEEQKERNKINKMNAAIKRDKKIAMKLSTGEFIPEKSVFKKSIIVGKQKSIVNRVTEYGALFNQLNELRISNGLPQLKTAMEVLIEAMQSNELDLKDKSKIAEKLATFESSRAPIISIEHVQNISKEEEVSADDALDDFLQSLRKV